MDVELAEERILLLADRFNLDHAEGRAWAKRTDAFGTVAKLGSLLNRAGSDKPAVTHSSSTWGKCWSRSFSSTRGFRP